MAVGHKRFIIRYAQLLDSLNISRKVSTGFYLAVCLFDLVDRKHCLNGVLFDSGAGLRPDDGTKVRIRQRWSL